MCKSPFPHLEFDAKLSSRDAGHRVHIHAGGEVINIHEEILTVRVYKNWKKDLTPKHIDAKGESHYEDCEGAYFWFTLEHWLYTSHWPSDDIIRAWNITGWTVPTEWEQGSESQPLAVSLAIEIYFDAWCKNWWTIVDAGITFIFEQYRVQRITPSPERLVQVYEWDHDNPLKDLFVTCTMVSATRTGVNSMISIRRARR